MNALAIAAVLAATPAPAGADVVFDIARPPPAERPLWGALSADEVDDRVLRADVGYDARPVSVAASLGYRIASDPWAYGPRASLSLAASRSLGGRDRLDLGAWRDLGGGPGGFGVSLTLRRALGR